MMVLKPWGKSTSVFEDRKTQVLEIVVDPGGYCSHHYHQDRDNLFWVFTGTLFVAWGPLLEEVVVLTSRHPPLVVPAKVEHRFWSLEGCHAYEQYRPIGIKDHDSNDIVRLDEGGRYLCDYVFNGSGLGREAPFRIPAYLANLGKIPT